MIKNSVIDNIDILTFQSSKGYLLTIDDIGFLSDFFSQAEQNNKIKGIILTGEGSGFCTGLNITSVIEDYSEEKSNTFFRTFDLLLFKLFSFPKPIVAAINGHSIGGGLLIQCCTDGAIIADNNNIKFGLPELKLGLTIDELMRSILSHYINNNHLISKILYSATSFDPKQSLEYGFAEKIVPQNDLLESCLSLVSRLLAFESKAFSITKRMVRADCIAKMQSALDKNCYYVFTELLNEKYLGK